MRAGRVDEAAALAKQIRAAIIRQNTAQLRRVNTKHCIKDAWAKVHIRITVVTRPQNSQRKT